MVNSADVRIPLFQGWSRLESNSVISGSRFIPNSAKSEKFFLDPVYNDINGELGIYLSRGRKLVVVNFYRGGDRMVDLTLISCCKYLFDNDSGTIVIT